MQKDELAHYAKDAWDIEYNTPLPAGKKLGEFIIAKIGI